MDNSQLEYETPPVVTKRNFFSASAKPIWIALLTSAVCVAGLLVYLLFFRGAATPETYQGDVKLEIVAPSEIPSGTEISYIVKLTNLTNIKLTKLHLELFYPEGFTFIDSIPDPVPEPHQNGTQSPASPSSFNFPELAPGGDDEIVIVGKLEGNIQEVKSFNVKLHYVPENFRSSFLAESSAQTVILAPELSLQVSGPAQAVTGQRAEYKIQITNISSQVFSNVTLQVQYPNKFVFLDANPAPSLSLPTRPPQEGGPSRGTPVRERETELGEVRWGGLEWNFPQIGIGETVHATLSGQLLAEAGLESVLVAELFLFSGSGSSFAAGKSFVFTEMNPSPLKLTHTIKSPGQLVPGAAVGYEVNYQNISSRPLTNVSLAVVFDSGVVDLKTIRSPAGQIQNNALVFIPAATSALRTVNPGVQGKFEFTAGIKTTLALSAVSPVLRSHTEFSSIEFPESLAGDALERKISTSVSLTAVPHRLGDSTYQITIELGSSVNEIKDAEIIFLLPRVDTRLKLDSVSPALERERITYNPAAGSVRWRVGSVFAFSPSFHEGRSLTFDLELTPGSIETGQSILLLSDLNFSGTDAWTGEAVEKGIEQITIR